MFQANLMQGQRILVTGGGTGLGRAMAEGFLALGADVAICGRRMAVCDETAAEWRAQFPERRIDTFGVDIRIAPAVDEMVESLFATRRAERPRQQRGRQLHRAHREPVGARLRRHRQHRVPRQLLRHAGGGQALGRAGQGRHLAARPAVSQRDEHHHHLGRQRQPLRRAIGDEQGRHRGDDDVAGGRVGASTASA